MEKSVMRLILGFVVLCTLIAALFHLVAYVRSLDGGAVRASVPPAIHEEPTDPRCCLIPANRGLNRGKPW